MKLRCETVMNSYAGFRLGVSPQSIWLRRRRIHRLVPGYGNRAFPVLRLHGRAVTGPPLADETRKNLLNPRLIFLGRRHVVHSYGQGYAAKLWQKKRAARPAFSISVLSRG
jgi:hypothetical protein